MKVYPMTAAAGVMLAAGCFFWLREPVDHASARVDIAPAAVAVIADQPKPVLGATPTPTPVASAPSTEGDLRAEERSERNRISRAILPLLNSLSGEGRLLHERLVSERRDTDWAPASERKMRSLYDDLKDFGGTGRALDIQCGATVCQVTGSLADGEAADRKKATAAVQSFELVQTMAAQGYSWQSTSIGKGGDGAPIFVSFFLRSAPEALRPPPAARAPGE